MSSTHCTTVSAPGKVLIAGGYLVLDRSHTGQAIATSSRFYTHLTSTPSPSPSSSSSSVITVRAAQFPREASTWVYDVRFNHGRSRLSITPREPRNTFVQVAVGKAVRVAWEVLHEKLGKRDKAGEELVRRLGGHGGLEVVVLADNDFYAQREQLAAANLRSRLASLAALPLFCALPRPIAQTNKTGLGSSAALVTSLVAGLLAHLGVVDLTRPSPAERELVHATAQLCHCLAQGKVGSGFDVSSAVYGSHTYRRFSPSLLSPLMDDLDPDGPLLPSLRAQWDHEVTPFRLPKELRLLLADVDAGTDTPSFVSQVLGWRKAHPDEAGRIWGELDTANGALGDVLRRLCGEEGRETYGEAMRNAGSNPIDKVSGADADGHGANAQLDAADPVASLLLHTRQSVESIRYAMQTLSTLSSVPIEPPTQSRLLDACSALPGVVGGGVPGAGGYDAIWLLVVDQPGVVSAVEDLWEGYEEVKVCPLVARESEGGLRVESGVRGLKEAMGR